MSAVITVDVRLKKCFFGWRHECCFGMVMLKLRVNEIILCITTSVRDPRQGLFHFFLCWYVRRQAPGLIPKQLWNLSVCLILELSVLTFVASGLCCETTNNQQQSVSVSYLLKWTYPDWVHLPQRITLSFHCFMAASSGVFQEEDQGILFKILVIHLF